VPAAVADQVAGLPPVGSLFAAFLGFNPIQELLAPSGVLQHLPAANVATLTGTEFFPRLISGPFQHGLFAAFLAALVMTLIGVVASALQGKEAKLELEVPVAAAAPGPAAMPVPTPTGAGLATVAAGSDAAGPNSAGVDSAGLNISGSNGATLDRVGPSSADPSASGSNSSGSDTAGSGTAGSGTAGSGTAGSGTAGSNGDSPKRSGADGVCLAGAGAVKDRLLRVLLADPARALRAVDDLETSKGQLAQLRESLDVERTQLDGAARRLRQAGLTSAQVARLIGRGGAELAEPGQHNGCASTSTEHVSAPTRSAHWIEPRASEGSGAVAPSNHN
jgi:hypothetical protein